LKAESSYEITLGAGSSSETVRFKSETEIEIEMKKEEVEKDDDWPVLSPKEAVEDIEMMCGRKMMSRKSLLTLEEGDEEYKRYVNVFLNLERRRRLHEVLKEAIDAMRHLNTKSHLNINMLRYLQSNKDEEEEGEDLGSILRSSETGRRIEMRLNRRLAAASKLKEEEYNPIEPVIEAFRLCTTPQIFLETIEEEFPKGRRLRFASTGPISEFTSSLRGGPYHETENMRTDMCRQIGPCFILNEHKIITKSLKQCVSDLSEAMRRVQISTCGEKIQCSSKGRDCLSRMMLRAADHVTSGSILVNTIGNILFSSENQGISKGQSAMASEVAMMIPASSSNDGDSDDIPPSFSLDVGCFVVKHDDHVTTTATTNSKEKHEDGDEKEEEEEEDDEERRIRVRTEAVATMRKEEVKRMKNWIVSRVGGDEEDNTTAEHLISLIDYIEATEDRCLRKGHTAQDFLRENDEEWGLSESWNQAVQMFLWECKHESSKRSWHWGIRARVRTTTEFRVYPNDTTYISQGNSPWAVVRGELDIHFGMPINGESVMLIGVDTYVSMV